MDSTDFDVLSLLRGLCDGQVFYRVDTLPDGSMAVEVAVGDPTAERDLVTANHDEKAEAAA